MSKPAKFMIYSLSVVLWIGIWYMAAKQIDNELFLPSPDKVIFVLFQEMLPSQSFRMSIAGSVFRIGTGFLIGAGVGILFAILSGICRWIDVLLWFPVKVIKSVPVASFVILALLWVDAEQLAIFIPAMVVMPILYINTLAGIRQINGKMKDMAHLFRIPYYKRILHIYIPQLISYILSACSLAVGMAWRAGVSAEIIGLAKNSIGNGLYQAKIYLMSAEMFAWTIVIVGLSIVCEAVIKGLIKLVER